MKPSTGGKKPQSKRRTKAGAPGQKPITPASFTTGDGGEASDKWNLRLYVAGETLRSRAAIENLKKICELYLDDGYTIEVIDLAKNPSLARGDQIVALPTLVRKIPVPMRKIIGDLSNIERVLVGLDIQPRKGT